MDMMDMGARAGAARKWTPERWAARESLRQHGPGINHKGNSAALWTSPVQYKQGDRQGAAVTSLWFGDKTHQGNDGDFCSDGYHGYSIISISHSCWIFVDSQ